MAISTIGGSISDNFETISSVTPTNATAAVDFTSLGVYQKLMIRFEGIVLTASGTIGCRINGDTGSNYSNSSLEWTSTSTTIDVTAPTTRFTFGGSGTTNINGVYLIENCDVNGVKIMSNGFQRFNTRYGKDPAMFYHGSAARVTSISFITTNTFTAVGTVTLYGAK